MAVVNGVWYPYEFSRQLQSWFKLALVDFVE